MDKHLYYMSKALEQAELALNIMEVPVGAVIVKDDTIIGTGFNTKEKNKNPIHHAEINAVVEACRNIGDWRLNGASIYVTCEPCIMCAGALIHARIDNLYFGITEHKFGGIISKDNILDKELNHKIKYEYGFLEDEISLLMKEFFKKLRNK